MTLAQFLRESEELFDWLDSSLQNLGIQGTLRSLLAVGCLELASEHHKAIVLSSSAVEGSEQLHAQRISVDCTEIPGRGNRTKLRSR
jgi:hypothetical protein